jgi:hypothetical protein
MGIETTNPEVHIMHRSLSRWHCLGLLLGLLALGHVAVAIGQNEAANKSKVDELLNERLAIYKELAGHAEKRYQNGTASFDEVLLAKAAVVRAELDQVTTGKDRVKRLEELVGLAKQREDFLAQMAQNGRVAQNEYFQAKIGRLDAQIAVEREKAK